MSDITINVENDEMLGRTTEKALHIELIKKDKEIERLNNIINELEEGLKSLYDFDKGVVPKDYLECVDDTLDKLQELKGSGE